MYKARCPVNMLHWGHGGCILTLVFYVCQQELTLSPTAAMAWAAAQTG